MNPKYKVIKMGKNLFDLVLSDPLDKDIQFSIKRIYNIVDKYYMIWINHNPRTKTCQNLSVLRRSLQVLSEKSNGYRYSFRIMEGIMTAEIKLSYAKGLIRCPRNVLIENHQQNIRQLKNDFGVLFDDLLNVKGHVRSNKSCEVLKWIDLDYLCCCACVRRQQILNRYDKYYKEEFDTLNNSQEINHDAIETDALLEEEMKDYGVFMTPNLFEGLHDLKE